MSGPVAESADQLIAIVAGTAGEPTGELGEAVAAGTTLGAGHGIALLERLAVDPQAGSLAATHAALGHFLAVVGRSREAASAYRRALALGPAEPGRVLLEGRLAALG